MTPWQACGWSALRALVVCWAALAVAHGVRSLLSRTDPPALRRLAWALLLTPLFTPAILIGYAYANLWLELVRHPWIIESLYTLLLIMKLSPAAALVVCLAPPPPLSPEAAHAARLLRRPPGSRLRLWAHGEARTAALALSLVFLLAFQEFEIASLLNAPAWSIKVFDTLAESVKPAYTLRQSLGPIAVELLALLPLAALLFPRLHEAWTTRQAPTRLPRAVRGLTWVYLFFAAIAAAGLPLALIAGPAYQGITDPEFPRHFHDLAPQLHADVLFALAGATIATVLAAAIARSRPVARIALSILACGPGLLGSLVLSLLILTLAASLGSRYIPPPLPLALALGLLMTLPAILLGSALSRKEHDSSIHSAKLLNHSLARHGRVSAARLRWDLSYRPRFWAAFLLFCWGYFDLTAPAILAPPGMDTAVRALYNQMHYNRTFTLSALLVVTILTPLLLLLAAWLVKAGQILWVKYA